MSSIYNKFIVTLFFLTSIIVLIVGWYNPKTVIKWGNEKNKTQFFVILIYEVLTMIISSFYASFIFSALCLIILVVLLCYSNLDNEKRKEVKCIISKEAHNLFTSKDQLELENNLKILNSKGLYKYVEKYAKKYKYIDDMYTEIEKLVGLLNSRGTSFGRTDVIKLVDEEIILQKYKSFKKKIISNKPTSIEQLIIKYVEIHGDSDKGVYFLQRLLKENKIERDTLQLIEKINNVRKQRKLERFESFLNSDQIEHISLNNLDHISGYEFESLLKKLFESMGYLVEQTKLSGDQGADLIVSKFGERTVVQAKRHSNKITNTAIQEVVAAIRFYKASKAMVVTTNEFTNSAIELAKANKVELIDRNIIEKWVECYL